MNLKFLTTSALSSATVLVCLTGTACADVIIPDQGDARVLTESTGNREDNNGGNTVSGAVIGINPGLIDNFMLYDFSDLSAAAGKTFSSARIAIFVQAITSTNGISASDTISISEIAIDNLGWDNGSGVITGADTPADDGSVSFLNQSQFNGSGTSVPWVDESGSDTDNLLGALTLIDTIAAFDVAPSWITFNVDAITAQRWADEGLGGLVVSSTDGDGNNQSRLNFSQLGAQITFIEVPEPGSLALLALGGLFLTRRPEGVAKSK